MKKILLTLLGLCSLTAVSAQTATKSSAEVEALKERVAQLEKRATVWDKLKPAFKFSGYIQAGYDYYWDEAGTSTSTFHLRRARVTMQGDVYKGKKGAKASYRLQLDFCRTPVIVDLWAKYQPVNQFGVQVGQFKLPFGIENTDYNALKLEFINYAQAIQRLARLGSGDMTGISSTGRDIGAQIYGGFIKKDGYSILNYELGVFNGSGINAKDNNKTKDIAARFTVQPLQKLKIAGYYMWGEADVTSLQSKYPAIVEGLAEGFNAKYVGYQRYGGGVDYNNKFLFARTEYIAGKTGELVSEGAYAQVGYKFLGKCTVGVRFDYFDENKAVDGYQMNYSAALSYHPWKHIRLQAEYTYQSYNKMAGATNGNRFYLMATAMF
ncbi:MAG: porin [Alistipes sp.]|nr:porin [Alistipes sp.]